MSFTPIQSNFYGDIHRWFIGVVIDVQDPLRVARVRVRIFGIHNEDVNEVPESSLPWAQVLIPTTEGGMSGIGRSVGLLPGAQVFGMFMDGEQSQVPVIMGSMPRFEKGDPIDQHVSRNSSTGATPMGNTSVSNNTIDTRSAVGGSNSEKSFNFFVTNGFTPIQASAIIGNLIQESNLDPGVTSGFTGEDSFGIAQWNPAVGRLQLLEEFSEERGLQIGELETQLAFLLYEFSTISPGYYGYAQFREMTNITTATEFFCDKYEAPNAAYAHKAQRVAHAKAVLEAYNGN
jgi:hypothetical protein|tara:strand:- start:134 stop:1000 length:867 start_codon:yes stop_codon:yes gene_type:complete